MNQKQLLFSGRVPTWTIAWRYLAIKGSVIVNRSECEALFCRLLLTIICLLVHRCHLWSNVLLPFSPLSHLHLSSPRSTVWSLPTSACLPGVALTCWLAAVIRHMVGRGIDRSPPRTKADLWGFLPPLFVRAEQQQHSRKRPRPPLDGASGKRIRRPFDGLLGISKFCFFIYPVVLHLKKKILSCDLLA